MTAEAKHRADTVKENLGEFGGSMTQKDISEKFGFPQSSISETVKMLRNEGAVTVTGQTPDDLSEDPMESIEALLKRQERAERLASLKKDQVVAIDSEKPVGVTLFSDIHWGATGLDVKALVADTKMVRDAEGMYAFCLGDLTDNWIGKLAGIAGEQSISIPQEKAAAEWWLEQLSGKMPVVVAGNHDNRTITQSHIDYVHEMLRGSQLLYGKDEVRFTLNVGDGVWKWKCRHLFKGNSQWNETHAAEKDGKMRDIWDFAASGHYHKPTIIRPFYNEMRDKLCYACNIGTYKGEDDYATMLGYRHHKTEYTATIIYFPDGRAHIAQGATLEESCRYLKYLRKSY
jgi:hypothetical protein